MPSTAKRAPILPCRLSRRVYLESMGQGGCSIMNLGRMSVARDVSSCESSSAEIVSMLLWGGGCGVDSHREGSTLVHGSGVDVFVHWNISSVMQGGGKGGGCPGGRRNFGKRMVVSWEALRQCRGKQKEGSRLSSKRCVNVSSKITMKMRSLERDGEGISKEF